MSERSAIEWTDHTFNPWWGCTRVSPGCTNCYAEAWARRFGTRWGPTAERRFFGEKHWNEPRKWDRRAGEAGVRERVFCASMADVFEDRDDLREPRQRLWDLMRDTPNLVWLLLTKRPYDVSRLSPDPPPPNAWLGITTETMQSLEDRLWQIRNTRATELFPKLFLSVEPMLEQISLNHPGLPLSGASIDWVIAGGESGPRARPMFASWARYLRDDCVDRNIPFFFKQWGEYDEHGNRVGKKRSGRLLDGREHNGLPSAFTGEDPSLTPGTDEYRHRLERELGQGRLA